MVQMVRQKFWSPFPEFTQVLGLAGDVSHHLRTVIPAVFFPNLNHLVNPTVISWNAYKNSNLRDSGSTR